jgi:hypothetical protein
MSTLALVAARVPTGRVGVSARLRGPLPAWAALFVNVLPFSSLPTVVPIPGSIGRLVLQGALIHAFLHVLLANPGRVPT